MARDCWVNAVITFTVPLDDVSVQASKVEKMDAVGRVLDRMVAVLPDDVAEHGAVAHWEDASDA